MNSDYDVQASIHLYPASQGGRSQPTPAGKFSSVLMIGSQAFDCRIFQRNKLPLNPGETTTAYIIFLYPSFVLPFLSEGIKFFLWEGKIIGEGVITTIVHERFFVSLT